MSKEIIVRMTGDYIKLNNIKLNNAEYVQDLVRCKECVLNGTEDCSTSWYDDDWGEWRIGEMPDDWYCADGERKESE